MSRVHRFSVRILSMRLLAGRWWARPICFVGVQRARFLRFQADSRAINGCNRCDTRRLPFF